MKVIKKTKQPAWILPMMATLIKEPFSDKEWIFEKKFDGMRCLVIKKGKNIMLYSRNRKKLNRSFPEIEKAFQKASKKDFIVDGEIVAFDKNVTSFEKLQNRMHLLDPTKAKEKTKVFFYAFDLLFFDGKDCRKLPLITRKKLLKTKISFLGLLRYSSHVKKQGEKLLKVARQKKEEGIIGKKAVSIYQSKRSREWIKLKCGKRQEFVILGFTPPKGSRKGFGALLVGYYEKKKLKYAGKVGTGYNEECLLTLGKRLRSIVRETSPLKEKLKEKEVNWVKPILVAEISFGQWTKANKLRQPAFVGLRKDKKASSVIRERER